MPAVIRPIQFHDVWSRQATVAPARRLALAVIREAVDDLARYRFGRGRRVQRLYWCAYEWIASDDQSWAFSFVSLCEISGLSAEAIRHQVFALTASPRMQRSGETPLEKAA